MPSGSKYAKKSPGPVFWTTKKINNCLLNIENLGKQAWGQICSNFSVLVLLVSDYIFLYILTSLFHCKPVQAEVEVNIVKLVYITIYIVCSVNFYSYFR
jgi:hypothetical protein